MQKAKPYIISVLIALAVGGLSALFTMGNMDIYDEIIKPSFEKYLSSKNSICSRGKKSPYVSCHKGDINARKEENSCSVSKVSCIKNAPFAVFCHYSTNAKKSQTMRKNFAKTIEKIFGIWYNFIMDYNGKVKIIFKKGEIRCLITK